jgi:hypothetical protein
MGPRRLNLALGFDDIRHRHHHHHHHHRQFEIHTRFQYLPAFISHSAAFVNSLLDASGVNGDKGKFTNSPARGQHAAGQKISPQISRTTHIF